MGDEYEHLPEERSCVHGIRLRHEIVLRPVGRDFAVQQAQRPGAERRVIIIIYNNDCYNNTIVWRIRISTIRRGIHREFEETYKGSPVSLGGGELQNIHPNVSNFGFRFRIRKNGFAEL